MSFFSAPIELIKIRQQSMLESGLGSISVSKLIYSIHREHGLKGLFRGLTATAFRDCGYGAYFLGVRALIAPLPWFDVHREV